MSSGANLLEPKRWCRCKSYPEHFEAHLADCKADAGRHKGTAYVGDASKQARPHRLLIVGKVSEEADGRHGVRQGAGGR